MTRFLHPGMSSFACVIWRECMVLQSSVLRCRVIQRFPRLVLLFVLATLPSEAAVSHPVSIPSVPLPETLEIASADAFVMQVFSTLDVEQYEAGANAYLWMLQQVDSVETQSEHDILLRHFRALAIVMPAEDRAASGLGAVLDPDILKNLKPDYSAYLERWWQRRDNLPATASNERLEEHLTRVAYVHRNFANRNDIRGFDDRGEIYIRLGDPSKKAEVKLLTPSLRVNAQSIALPSNEFWVYRHIARDIQYLFIEERRGRGYFLGQSLDLIPNRLQSSRRYTASLLQWMEEVYGQLSLFHSAYGQRSDELSTFLTAGGTGVNSYDLFARSMLSQARTEDAQIEYQRTQATPTIYSNTHGIAAHLRVDVRWARFLNDDGSTRTEIYWGLKKEALTPSRQLLRAFYKQGHEPSDRYLLAAAATQFNERGQASLAAQKHYLLPADVAGPIPPKTLVVEENAARYSLALQWDQRWTLDSEDGALLPGARIQVGIHHIDSLAALHDEGKKLEMSDIKPLHPSTDNLLENAPPYAAQSLRLETNLALYFEIYNLAFGADDEAHYAIAYELVRKDRRGLFRLNEPSDEIIGAQTVYTNTSRTAREFIIPDLNQLDYKGPLEIVVRVTDQTSGQEVNRSIAFVVE